MNKINAVILKNESNDDHIEWINSCERYSHLVNYRIVDLTSDEWIEKIRLHPVDILLTKPGGLTSTFKQLYDERAFILEKILKYQLFPKSEEIFIYENKRFLSYWLKSFNLPHPSTHVFYDIKEANAFLQRTSYPIVAKTNIGASGSGVVILKDQIKAIDYITETFLGKGAPQRSGPNFRKTGLLKRGVHYIFNPYDIQKKIRLYKIKRTHLQSGFVILQEFIPHDYEWRVVRIGHSFFAHKKLKLGDKTSGSTLKGYENPPFKLLDFVKKITDEHEFYSQAIDLFENDRGDYLINEMQCIFGQSDPYQMLIDGKPGRYKYINDSWHFEEGDFAKNACFDLRLEHVISLIKSK